MIHKQLASNDGACSPRIDIQTPTYQGSKTMDWRHRALCRDEDPELFFPIGNTGPALLQIEEAKAVCRRCPVVSECLSWALDSGQDAGVWGGMSEDERRALKRRGVRHRTARV
jgi:WhiB family transcriptional regulator, redox-sensing transcriptional regulator